MTDKVSTSLKNAGNLVWLDMEMTGLDATQNVILEVAVVITDSDLNIIAQSPSYAIFQPDDELKKMDKWNVNTHTKTGLIDRVKASTLSESQAEEELLKLIQTYTIKGKAPLCGNTIYQDRKFVIKFMPKLEEHLHYRNLDVSTIKELAKRWHPSIYGSFKKQNKHEALADIFESINELKHYRENLFIK